MSRVAPLWIREAEVARLLDLDAAIAALELGFAAEADGTVAHLQKTMASFEGGGTLHALGAVLGEASGAAGTSEGVAGTKTWVHSAGGASPLLVLWRAEDGALLAVIEAFALGQLRTSGVSALATRLLADPAADELAIVGTGKQALAQVAAVVAVRPIARVRVYGRDAGRRARFAERVERELGLAARAAESVAECVRDAGVVTTVTRATDAFLDASMLHRGAHVNAIGAIAPDRAEISPDVAARASLIVADSPAQALRQARELGAPSGSAALGTVERPEGALVPVVALSEVVRGRVRRPPSAALTLFKAMGLGLADVALGSEVLRRARERGAGRALDPPEHVEPTLVSRSVARGREVTHGGSTWRS